MPIYPIFNLFAIFDDNCRTYLINANSKQDRDEWIEAIRKALPTSPHQRRKNEGSPKRIKEEPKEKIPLDPPPPYHPPTTARQDTAAVAATVATENERLNGVDEVYNLISVY